MHAMNVKNLKDCYDQIKHGRFLKKTKCVELPYTMESRGMGPQDITTRMMRAKKNNLRGKGRYGILDEVFRLTLTRTINIDKDY